MKKLTKILSSTLLVIGLISVSAKAAYYTYGNGGDYMGKLNIFMNGETRYALAGTYVQDGKYIVNTILAEVYDNGVLKSTAPGSFTDGATTSTVIVNYSGVVGYHEIYSPTHGSWSAYT